MCSLLLWHLNYITCVCSHLLLIKSPAKSVSVILIHHNELFESVCLMWDEEKLCISCVCVCFSNVSDVCRCEIDIDKINTILSQFVKEKNDKSGHIMSHFQCITLMMYNLRPYFTQRRLYFSLQLRWLSHCLDINSHDLDYVIRPCKPDLSGHFE